MAKRARRTPPAPTGPVPRAGGGRPSSLLDTRVIYCGDNLEQLAKPALSLPNGLPDRYIDLIPSTSFSTADTSKSSTAENPIRGVFL